MDSNGPKSPLPSVQLRHFAGEVGLLPVTLTPCYSLYHSLPHPLFRQTRIFWQLDVVCLQVCCLVFLRPGYSLNKSKVECLFRHPQPSNFSSLPNPHHPNTKTCENKHNPNMSSVGPTPTNAVERYLSALLTRPLLAMIRRKNAMIRQKNAIISRKNAIIDHKNAYISHKDDLINHQNAYISYKDNLLNLRQAMLENVQLIIASKDEVIANENKRLAVLDKFNATLLARIVHLEDLLGDRLAARQASVSDGVRIRFRQAQLGDRLDDFTAQLNDMHSRDGDDAGASQRLAETLKQEIEAMTASIEALLVWKKKATVAVGEEFGSEEQVFGSEEEEVGSEEEVGAEEEFGAADQPMDEA
ncbi:hypothetical protein HBI56_222040 [Parastagonospora nodorum]|nr:hypothetical protein HBH53_225100 [Parastagonospora nodorum]KAH4013507.1 hypothetical protein HBI09_215820 [Parastagonospora nodorum]KAH4084462.1 hypothetical protein HBH46_213310 [Parastagonospora nodorum]KAH4190244.1 hypothetical protein HBI95_219660 [Parastagonospora nodorum]KAH4216884.1 hypothetical protein HBI06_222190 [Parastagonospora nodorum]